MTSADRAEAEAREGEGSTFTVYLPLRIRDEEIPAGRERRPVKYVVEGLYVMVVEDNTASLMLMETLLKKRGCYVDTAVSGQEALDRLRMRRYEVVFMDVQLPGTDGYEVTRIIRDSHSSVLDHNVHIVAITARVQEGDRERCLEAGMNDYLTKPINGDMLDEVLARVQQ